MFTQRINVSRVFLRVCLSAFPKASKGQCEGGAGSGRFVCVCVRVLQCDKIEAKWKSVFFTLKEKKENLISAKHGPTGSASERDKGWLKERGPDDTGREVTAGKRSQTLLDKTWKL